MADLNMDKPMKVLILVDVYGWAFDFNARGIKDHSTKFDCVIKTPGEVTRKDGEHDLVFSMDYRFAWQGLHRRKSFLEKIPRCVGIRSALIPPQIREFKAIACNSTSTYNKAKNQFPELNIHYTPNGVDTQIFKPAPKKEPNKFILGWAGAAERKSKRVKLAQKLNYPISIKSERWGKHFRKGASRQKMVDFYHSVDCVVCTSSTEGMNNVVLEAAACGLPVVSTIVGDVSLLISKDWLVPTNPPKRMMTEMNAKLALLKNNLDLRLKVGKRNREEIIKNWSWEEQVPAYERMFEGVLSA